MSTKLQIQIEKQRVVYGQLRRPLLAQLVEVYRLSVRDFAEIMGISKSYCQEILNEEKVPSLELAFKIARYFEVAVEDIFSYRFDDDGARRPLVIEIKGEPIRLKSSDIMHSTMVILAEVLKAMNIRTDGSRGEQCTSSESTSASPEQSQS